MRRMQEAIGACRDEIKGAAILWVVFFHAQLGLGGLLYDVQKIGYGGVDMFLFLSGFGLYHSLSRDADAGRYLLRRERRLLPAYLPFCVVWLCVMLPLYDLGTVQSVRVAAGNLLMLGFFASTPAMINWYVSALALTLLAAPLVYGLMARSAQPRRCAVLLAAAIAVGFIGVGIQYLSGVAGSFAVYLV
ncbi:MAG TPA: acyltransferase family protein, partial [Candidatus Limiplasma pullistercoris]|nr:acyltransferase family protein [Candidatus Limiplasma pullistercoris]